MKRSVWSCSEKPRAFVAMPFAARARAPLRPARVNMAPHHALAGASAAGASGAAAAGGCSALAGVPGRGSASSPTAAASLSLPSPPLPPPLLLAPPPPPPLAVTSAGWWLKALPRIAARSLAE